MYLKAKILFCFAIYFLATCSHSEADVRFNAIGISGKGVNVSFEAELSISGNVLDLYIRNISTDAILNPDDLLSSFYFDIVNESGDRPSLSSFSASGDVYLTDNSGPELLDESQADLVAVNSGDGTWQFKPMDVEQLPFSGFGIGTVGNSGISPNNFDGNIVGAINYSIYAGEITTRNLDNRLLVKDEIHFAFSGLNGFDENDITRRVVFGLGTAPDSLLIAVPEPSSTGLLFLCGASISLRRRK